MEDWFSLTNREPLLDQESYEALFSKNLMDKNKFAELVKTDKFQQILHEFFHLKWK